MLTNKPKQCPFKLSMFTKRIWVQVIECVIISSNGIESKRKNDILYLKGNENKRKCEWPPLVGSLMTPNTQMP